MMGFRSSIFHSVLFGGRPSGAPPGSLDPVSDTFTDTNSTLLSAHTPDDGGPWVNNAGDFVVFGNRALPSTDGLDHISTIDTGGTDLTATVDVHVANNARFAGGIVFRFVDTSNYWLLRIQRDGSSPAQVRLIEMTGGSETVRDTHDDESMGGTTVEIQVVVSGSSIIGKLNGSTVVSYNSATHASATKQGLENYYTTGDFGYIRHEFDNFEVTT